MHLPMPSSAPSWNTHDLRRVVNADGGFIEATYPWGSGERLPIVALPSDWTLAAACIGSEAHETALASIRVRIARRAKAECITCPVREQCLEQAMRVEGDSPPRFRHGISGGLTPLERFALFEQGGTQPQASAESAPYALTEALSA